MRYKDFEKRIKEMVTAASDDARRRSALDTIRLLYASAKVPATEELTPKEQQLLTELVKCANSLPIEELQPLLERLSKSTSDDEVRAIEIHSDIVELMCAIDNWIAYRRTGDPHSIFGLAINRVNSVDFALGGNTDIENMFAAPEMVDEFERQRILLLSSSR